MITAYCNTEINWPVVPHNIVENRYVFHGPYIQFLNENIWILITIWLEFVPKGQIDNNTALVQIMAWYPIGDKLFIWANDGLDGRRIYVTLMS